MLKSLEEKGGIESEKLLADILYLKRIISEMPELAEKRKKLIKRRLSVIKRIRDARKTGKESDLRKLFRIHNDLGKRINRIDMIIEKGLELQSKI